MSEFCASACPLHEDRVYEYSNVPGKMVAAEKVFKRKTRDRFPLLMKTLLPCLPGFISILIISTNFVFVGLISVLQLSSFFSEMHHLRWLQGFDQPRPPVNVPHVLDV